MPGGGEPALDDLLELRRGHPGVRGHHQLEQAMLAGGGYRLEIAQRDVDDRWSKESQPFFFKEHDPRECSQTWQVERGEFDKMLFDNAAQQGADCHDGVRVRDVLFDGDRARGVKLYLGDGESRESRSSQGRPSGPT